ncbi:hypothetical protein DN069_07410 [Streptacidiphilus pinicola]|uniref:Uncharacterized protein n=1 Tax=Streptacidiphilus pinicola TaxID=2219663 RepID=A0A2X0JFA7_9ACTN|nr:hypothetical protein [Streptacidiphilus pinicola]RAG86278.1 hypothetical protein DN069_07410 [Streptacidiphilus pinicola]
MTADAALPAATAPLRPRTLTAGAWFSIAQGVVIAAYGVYVMVAPLTSTTKTGIGMTEFAGGLLLLMGLLPLAAGRALLQLKKWGRSPAVMVDTLCLAVAYFTFQNGGAFIALGVAVGLAGIAGIVLLLHPRTTAALWPSGQ